MSVEDTLAEREKQHGTFALHSQIEQALKDAAGRCCHESVIKMSDVQHTGLSMIFHKIARILNGGFNHIDSWHDIAGYATLVEKDMLLKQKEKDWRTTQLADVKALDNHVPNYDNATIMCKYCSEPLVANEPGRSINRHKQMHSDCIRTLKAELQDE